MSSLDVMYKGTSQYRLFQNFRVTEITRKTTYFSFHKKVVGIT